MLNIYFVAVDYVLLAQVMFYERDKLNSTLRIVMLFTLLALWSFPLAPTGEKYTPWRKERVHVAAAHWYNERQLRTLLGQLMGWLSSLCYIVARFPQILANLRKDRSVESPPIQLFLASIVANACYVLFMVLGPPDPSLLAWIVSSVLTVVLDILIILQFLCAPHAKHDGALLPTTAHRSTLDASAASTTDLSDVESLSDVRNIKNADSGIVNDVALESPSAARYNDASQHHASHDSILASVVISRDHDPSQQRGRSPGVLRMPIWR